MTRKDAFLLPHPELIRVLALLADGRTTAAIGREMHLSIDAVKTRQRRIYQQLGAHNATQAVAIAIRQGLLPAQQLAGWPPEAWIFTNARGETSDVLYLSEDRAKQAAIDGFLDDGISDAPFDWHPTLGGLTGEQKLHHDGEPTGWRVAVQIWADDPRWERAA